MQARNERAAKIGQKDDW